MSTFEGTGRRVRFIDCTRLDGRACAVKKNVKVAPRKRRSCTEYRFKGEYVNREALSSLYIPYVDKKVRRIMRRLMELGISPVAGGDPNLIAVPRTTATTGVDPALATEEPLIWTPDSNG